MRHQTIRIDLEGDRSTATLPDDPISPSYRTTRKADGEEPEDTVALARRAAEGLARKLQLEGAIVAGVGALPENGLAVLLELPDPEEPPDASAALA